MPVTQAFDAGIGIALLSDQRFKADFLIANDRFALPHLLVQGLPAQRGQLRLELTLFGFVFLVLLGGLGLTVQTFKLATQLFTQVGQAREVFVGATNAVFGLATPLLVLGDAGRFFDKVAQVFGLGLDQLGDHALLDDRVAARPQAGAEENIGDVTTTALGAVEVVSGLAVAGHLAADGNLGVGRIFAQQRAVGVIKHQFNAGLTHGFTAGGAVEDDVGHRLAAQVFSRAFAHYPAYGVDNVRLAATVGANHRRHIARKVNRCRVNEGFEARQFNALETHVQATVKADNTRSQLR